jgi:hypothetical protein
MDRTTIALGFMTAFVSNPGFWEQLNEVEEDTLHDLGERTARDAFDMADAFLAVAAEKEGQS